MYTQGRTIALLLWVSGVASLLLGVLFGPVRAGDEDWQTYYEKSGEKATPRYAETIAYCKRLDEGSPWIRYTTFGVSPQGRDMPLLIVSSSKSFTPEAAAKIRRRGDIVLLVQAGIHSGEIAGKDAGLMLFR
ncbi:MAG: M14 family zinc carboxypeptidase, partial [bacterium]